MSAAFEGCPPSHDLGFNLPSLHPGYLLPDDLATPNRGLRGASNMNLGSNIWFFLVSFLLLFLNTYPRWVLQPSVPAVSLRHFPSLARCCWHWGPWAYLFCAEMREKWWKTDPALPPPTPACRDKHLASTSSASVLLYLFITQSCQLLNYFYCSPLNNIQSVTIFQVMWCP